MKIYKVTNKFCSYRPIYLVVDKLSEIEPLLNKVYPDMDIEIVDVQLVSDNVINLWA